MEGHRTRLQNRDLHEQPPEVHRTVDLELAGSAAPKERAKHRLDDILSVHSSREIAAQMLLRESRKPARVPRVESALRSRVAGPRPFHLLARLVCAVHDAQKNLRGSERFDNRNMN